jgi:hypothetical protein
MAVIDQEFTDRYAIYNGDCVEVMPSLPDGRPPVIYSPPFCGLYHYSVVRAGPVELPDLRRVLRALRVRRPRDDRLLKPGRMAAVHCMDVPKDGANLCGYIDFPGDMIRLHERVGFEYTPRICIWKEPLAVRNRTMAKALAHRQIVEDSTLTNVACADYLIPFRKKGQEPGPGRPPERADGLRGRASGPARPAQVPGLEGQADRESVLALDLAAVRLGVLGRRPPRPRPALQGGREADDERHMHPLQLDVIERACRDAALDEPRREAGTDAVHGRRLEVYGAVINGRTAGWRSSRAADRRPAEVVRRLKPTRDCRRYRQAPRTTSCCRS